MDKIQKDIDKYYAIAEKKRSEIKEKGSKFIATVFPVKTLEEAEAKLGETRLEFHDATHNCFAWQFGWDEEPFRYSDDGEPSGSAGKPIYYSIKKAGVSDVLVVVTRYYGGTKLGVGGLARAYSGAADQTLQLCKKKTIFRVKPVLINCSYEEISAVKRLVDAEATSFDENYTDKVEITAKIPISKAEQFVADIVNSTAGRAEAKIL